MDTIVRYIDELMEKSTPDRPIWNIEKNSPGHQIKMELYRWMHD